MRVCILTHTFPRFEKDVAAPFMHGVANAIASAGNEVFVLTPYARGLKKRRKGQKYKLVTYKYIFPDSFHKLGYSQTLANDMGLRPIVFFLSPFLYFFGAVALYRLVKRKKIDMINAHWILPNGFIASLVSKLTGVPVVSTLPGSDVYMVAKNSFFKWMGRFATETSRAITSNSPQLIADLKALTGVKVDGFFPIIYGVDPQEFRPIKKSPIDVRRRYGIPRNSILVLGVGRLVEKKGFHYLVKAARIVVKENKNVAFLLAGEGDQRGDLERLIKENGLSREFILAGAVDHKSLLSYFNQADIFILPSMRDQEGNLDDQSVSVVEAMACGTPVVTTDFPGYRLVIENGKNGFLVEQKNSSAIAKTLIRLLESPPLRKKMGQNALNSIRENYSWEAIGRQYSCLFKRVIQERSGYSSHIGKILDKKSRRVVASQILRVLKIHLTKDTKKLKVLDVGCSSGEVTKYLAPNFSSVVGIDTDVNAIKITQDHKPANVEFMEMDAEKMPFKDNSFDVVIANQVYEFVKDDRKVFSEIKRVLKKGGICFTGAYNKYALIEPQYNLPFLAFMPKRVSDWIVRILGLDNEFIGRYKSYWQLKKLFREFKIFDYTLEILRNPKKYGYKRLIKYRFISRFLPMRILKPFIPNYIWILEKDSG